MTNQPDDVRTGSLTGDDSETAPGLSPGHTVAHEPERRHDGVEHGPTRIGAVWVATGVALLLAVLLLVFILQNQQQARIDFLGFSGEAPLGVALLVAAVAGGLLVGIAGAARVAQLRHRVKRAQRAG